MKSTPAALLVSEYRCSCWKLVRTDGVTLGFTEHDIDLVIDGLTYQAASGFARTATRQTANSAQDNHDVFGIFDSAAISETDLAAGLYSGARVYHFEVDWTDPAGPKHKLDAGVIGPVTRNRAGFSATVMNLKDLLSQTIGKTYARSCWHTLGDAGCQVELLPDDWTASVAVSMLDAVKATAYDGRRYVCTTAGTTGATEPTWDTIIGNTTVDGTAEWTCYEAYTKQGTVTGVTNNQLCQDTGRGEAAGAFDFGWITWVTGSNAGLQMTVKQYLADGSIKLLFPMPFDIQVGDSYQLVRGCNKQAKLEGDAWGAPYTGDCRGKFNPEADGNVARYGGFPELPSASKVMGGPQ